jgi:hypothetical protein
MHPQGRKTDSPSARCGACFSPSFRFFSLVVVSLAIGILLPL